MRRKRQLEDYTAQEPQQDKLARERPQNIVPDDKMSESRRSFARPEDHAPPAGLTLSNCQAPSQEIRGGQLVVGRKRTGWVLRACYQNFVTAHRLLFQHLNHIPQRGWYMVEEMRYHKVLNGGIMGHQPTQRVLACDLRRPTRKLGKHSLSDLAQVAP